MTKIQEIRLIRGKILIDMERLRKTNHPKCYMQIASEEVRRLDELINELR